MSAHVVQNHLSGRSRRGGVLEHQMARRKAAKTWWIYEQSSIVDPLVLRPCRPYPPLSFSAVYDLLNLWGCLTLLAGEGSRPWVSCPVRRVASRRRGAIIL